MLLPRSKQNAEVILLLNIYTVGNINGIYFLAFVTGLDGDQRIAKKIFGCLLYFVDSFAQNNSLGVAVFGTPLPRPPA